ncbi:MAG: glycerol-3-phosphate responsive antiterminator [Peptoniphilaceae bacterium]|nr:glycerol-3-phosphate responsive antiterminator [Peptoniphilaceae bacterium]MDD7383125.1 glycerol-3-phosphate responsive antiterminator [Peptoniphilaceae bacterium]MDY3738371.1 glycerol-3-phosphate responsive antiterminator [Peptoniphilaceae bacterium]
MNRRNIFNEIEQNPKIIAIKDNRDLDKAIENDIKVVFVLTGDITNIQNIVSKLKRAGKYVIVHEDLIEGLSHSSIASEFILKYTQADGIITTKPANAEKAKQIGLFTVLRFFVLDSLSLETIKQTIKSSSADLIEILPGVIPKVIKKLSSRTNIPIIAGGLITEKKEVIESLNSGAIAVSSSNYDVWEM